MSKYKRSVRLAVSRLRILKEQGVEWCQPVIEDILKLEDIADRLEQADVISNEEIYIKACRRYGCWGSECPYKVRDKFCPDLAEIFFDGYIQALDDLRGDNDD